MSIKKMREEFEKYQIDSGRTDPLWFENAWFSETHNEYTLNDVNADWEQWQAAWKASRESLVIELPEMIGMNQPFTGTPISEIRAHNHFNDAITQCRESIHTAGVKTK